MNYTTPTNEEKKLIRTTENKDSSSISTDETPTRVSGDNSFLPTKNSSLSDIPNESPIAFDKSAILPLEELEVNYEWISPNDEFKPQTPPLNASEDADTASDDLDESFTLSKKSSLPTMKSTSNLFLGILLSLIGALGAAFIWGKTTMFIDEYIEQHHYAFMAILVGLFAALGMRIGGRGHSATFGIIAILITILGCFIGNVLAAVEPIVQSFQLSYVETFTTFDISHLWGFLKDRFEYVDIAFYGIGLFFAYYLSFTKPKRLFS